MNKLTLQTRRLSRDGTDPEPCRIGWWDVIDGRVCLLDSGGKNTGELRVSPKGADPKLLATRMLRSKISTPKSISVARCAIRLWGKSNQQKRPPGYLLPATF